METVWVRSKDSVQQGGWVASAATGFCMMHGEWGSLASGPSFAMSGTNCTTGALIFLKRNHWLLSGLLGNAVLFSSLLIYFTADAYLNNDPFIKTA